MIFKIGDVVCIKTAQVHLYADRRDDAHLEDYKNFVRKLTKDYIVTRYYSDFTNLKDIKFAVPTKLLIHKKEKEFLETLNEISGPHE